jgi:chemotaxis methyl-accepting protein methylase
LLSFVFAMSPCDLGRLLRFLRDEHGLDFDALPEDVVRSRVERTMRRLGVTSSSELQSRLAADVRDRISVLVDLTRPCRRTRVYSAA